MHCFWAANTSDVLLFRRWDLTRWLCLMKHLRGRICPEDLVQEDMVIGTVLMQWLAISIHCAAIGRDYTLWKDSWTSSKTGSSYKVLGVKRMLDFKGLLWLPVAKIVWDLLHVVTISRRRPLSSITLSKMPSPLEDKTSNQPRGGTA